MPQIPVNLSSVEAYDNLPEGSYLGQIDKIEWRPAKEAGKFPQLMATYVVIDGEHLQRKSSEFISLSPKAAFRLKRWFGYFGLDNQENLDVDDETDQLVDPDLIGVQVIFQVRADGFRQGSTTEKRYRTELVSVEDDMTQQATGTAAPEPEPEPEPETEEEQKAVAAPVRPARPAPTVAPAQRRTLR